MSEQPPVVSTFLAREADGVLLGPDTAPGRYPRAGVAVRDLADLRALVLPEGVLAPTLGVLVTSDPGALGFVPRPDLPPLKAFRSVAKSGGRWTVLRFGRPVDVGEVVHDLGRQAVWHDLAVARPTVDARVFNPIGFLVDADGPEIEALDLRDGVTPSLVEGLRSAAGVRVAEWTPEWTAALPALACAGVPVTSETAPEGIPGRVATALTAPVDLADRRAREEHSIVLRRAALDAWAPSPQPTVSILLATKRADMVPFALEQVARQRGVEDLELVLAPHGFDVDPARVRDALGPSVAVRVVPQPDDALFGDVLHAAALAAGGDVLLKMDDDDWYAPDAVADLLRARAYSGAEVVGMPPELHYLTELDVTAERGHPSELYHRFVAGGTMLIDRAALREAGGFRSTTRFVDAQLLDGVLATGGAVYRTHGLGYVLRRNPTGHTWQADLQFLLDPVRTRATHEGLRPSRLMELRG